MAFNPNKDLKLYYSIREVAEMFEINESTLRYWEKVFPVIRPKTYGGGIRQYTKEDIDEIKIIHNMVKVRGYKLAAAKKMITANRKGVDKSTEVLNRLINARDQLKELKKHFDQLV